MHNYWSIVQPRQLNELAGIWSQWRRKVSGVSRLRRWYWQAFSRTAESDSVNLYYRSLDDLRTR